jgi:hypothetical protein
MFQLGSIVIFILIHRDLERSLADKVQQAPQRRAETPTEY